MSTISARPADRPATGGVGLAAGTSQNPGVELFGLRIPFAVLLGTLPIYIGLVAIWMYFYLWTSGDYFLPRNISNAVQGYAYKPALALGIVLVLLLGEIDLSVAYLTSLSAALCASFLYFNGWSSGLSIAVTIVLCTICGAVQGCLVAWVRMPSFVVTLGGFLIFEGVSNHMAGATAIPVQDAFIQSVGTTFIPGGLGLAIGGVLAVLYAVYRIYVRTTRARAGIRTESPLGFALTLVLPVAVGLFLLWDLQEYRGVPTPFAMLCVLVGVFLFMTTRMPFGRHVYAVGGNTEAARRAGINTTFIKWSCFAISGCMAGVAGIMLLGQVPTASTTLVSPDLLLDVISIAVIGGVSLTGGKGSVWSVLLGFLVIASVDNGLVLQATDPYVVSAVKGAILLIAIFLDVAGKRVGTMSTALERLRTAVSGAAWLVILAGVLAVYSTLLPWTSATDLVNGANELAAGISVGNDGWYVLALAALAMAIQVVAFIRGHEERVLQGVAELVLGAGLSFVAFRDIYNVAAAAKSSSTLQDILTGESHAANVSVGWYGGIWVAAVAGVLVIIGGLWHLALTVRLQQGSALSGIRPAAG